MSGLGKRLEMGRLTLTVQVDARLLSDVVRNGSSFTTPTALTLFLSVLNISHRYPEHILDIYRPKLLFNFFDRARDLVSAGDVVLVVFHLHSLIFSNLEKTFGWLDGIQHSNIRSCFSKDLGKCKAKTSGPRLSGQQFCLSQRTLRY